MLYSPLLLLGDAVGAHGSSSFEAFLFFDPPGFALVFPTVEAAATMHASPSFAGAPVSALVFAPLFLVAVLITATFVAAAFVAGFFAPLLLRIIFLTPVVATLPAIERAPVYGAALVAVFAVTADPMVGIAPNPYMTMSPRSTVCGAGLGAATILASGRGCGLISRSDGRPRGGANRTDW